MGPGTEGTLNQRENMRTRAPAALLLLVVAAACTSVSENEHCIETRYGKVVSERMPNGLNGTFMTDATCFPLTDQQYPGEGGAAQFTAMAKDSILVTGQFTWVWAHNPVEIVKLYRAKGDRDRAEAEIEQGALTGLQNAVVKFTSSELNQKPELLDQEVRAAIDRVQQGRAITKRVFVRNVLPPQPILAARQAAQLADQNLVTAQKQNIADSVKARSRVYDAQATAEAKRLEAQSYSQSPALMEMEVRKAAAAALANVCGQATTCILGASTLEQFLAGRR